MIFISKSFRTIVFVFIVFFHNVSATASSGLPQMSPVHLGINRGHLRKAGGYSGRNVMKKTIKTKTIVRKLLLIEDKVSEFSIRQM